MKFWDSSIVKKLEPTDVIATIFGGKGRDQFEPQLEPIECLDFPLRHELTISTSLLTEVATKHLKRVHSVSIGGAMGQKMTRIPEAIWDMSALQNMTIYGDKLFLDVLRKGVPETVKKISYIGKPLKIPQEYVSQNVKAISLPASETFIFFDPASFPSLEYFELQLGTRKHKKEREELACILENLDSLMALSIHPADEKFAYSSIPKSIKKLMLVGAKSPDLSAFSDLKNLTGLWLKHPTKLDSLNGIQGLVNLEHFALSGGKNINDLERILSLSNLRTAVINCPSDQAANIKKTLKENGVDVK